MSQEMGIVEERLERRDDMVLVLQVGKRRERQEAARMLAQLSQEDALLVSEVADDLAAALERPEAQTRWECLNALSNVALVAPDCVASAFEGAEESLFDESSAPVRLSAFRFLCRFGAASPERSQQAWPLVREAVQCYHGDPEYREMLSCLLEFAQGQLAEDVRADLVRRMKYDAKNGRGMVRKLSVEISAAAKGA